jgi:hypothetical protein
MTVFTSMVTKLYSNNTHTAQRSTRGGRRTRSQEMMEELNKCLVHKAFNYSEGNLK